MYFNHEVTVCRISVYEVYYTWLIKPLFSIYHKFSAIVRTKISIYIFYHINFVKVYLSVHFQIKKSRSRKQKFCVK